jgi:hypothetical protein
MSCTCGVRLRQTVELPADSGLEVLRLAEGSYAVLESGGCSDRGSFITLLDTWIQENGWSKEELPAYATYETGGRDVPESITMKVWIRLKDVKNR